MAILPVTRGAPSGEYLQDRPQDAVQTKLDVVQQAVSDRGPPPTVLGPFTFTAGGSVTIDHKLQRQPVSWETVDVIGGYGVFQRTAWSRLNITIQSANVCTAWFRIA